VTGNAQRIVAWILALVGCSSNTRSTGDDAGDGTTGNTTGPGSVASPECDAYLECVLAATPDAYGGALALYGPNSDCRTSTPAVVAACEQACRDATDNLHETFPEAAACGVGADGSGGSDESSGSGGTGGHTVSGAISIVNAGGGSVTSVILADATGFDPDAVHSARPDGPTAVNISTVWSIPDVADGTYWLLVAFDDDELVLDPDAHGEFPMVVVQGQDVMLAASKVTGALAVVSPSGGQKIAGAPTFVWRDDSSEDNYELRLFAADGTLVWENLDVPAVDGAAEVTEMYGGPPLASGLYQFRVRSIAHGAALTRTEDLAGVFAVE
jgi:hypothetical protein